MGFEKKKLLFVFLLLLRFIKKNRVTQFFILPQGPQGEPGPPGQQGNPGAQVSDEQVF